MAAHLSAEQVGLALRLRARGLTLSEVGRQVSCHLREVHRLARGELRRLPPVRVAAGAGPAGAG